MDPVEPKRAIRLRADSVSAPAAAFLVWVCLALMNFFGIRSKDKTLSSFQSGLYPTLQGIGNFSVITQARHFVLSAQLADRLHIVNKPVLAHGGQLQRAQYIATDQVIIIHILAAQVFFQFFSKSLQVTRL